MASKKAAAVALTDETLPPLIADFLSRAPASAVASVRFDCEPPAALAERLLRARKGSVDAAVALVQEIAAWRVSRGVAALCARPLADALGGLAYDELHALHAKAYFPYPDKHGRPIYVERTGGADADLLTALTSLDVLEAHHIISMEVDVRNLYALASRAAGRAVTKQTTILDFAGMSMRLANANSRACVWPRARRRAAVCAAAALASPSDSRLPPLAQLRQAHVRAGHGGVPRVAGPHADHQRAVLLFRGVEHGERLPRPEHGVEDLYPRRTLRVAAQAARAHRRRPHARRVRRHAGRARRPLSRGAHGARGAGRG